MKRPAREPARRFQRRTIPSLTWCTRRTIRLSDLRVGAARRAVDASVVARARLSAASRAADAKLTARRGSELQRAPRLAASQRCRQRTWPGRQSRQADCATSGLTWSGATQLSSHGNRFANLADGAQRTRGGASRIRVRARLTSETRRLHSRNNKLLTAEKQKS